MSWGGCRALRGVLRAFPIQHWNLPPLAVSVAGSLQKATNTQPCLACPQEEVASPDHRWHPRKAFKFRSAEGTGPGGYSMYMYGGPGERRSSSRSRRTCGSSSFPPLHPMGSSLAVLVQALTPLAETLSLAWGWSRCAGAGLDL